MCAQCPKHNKAVQLTPNFSLSIDLCPAFYCTVWPLRARKSLRPAQLTAVAMLNQVSVVVYTPPDDEAVIRNLLHDLERYINEYAPSLHGFPGLSS